MSIKVVDSNEKKFILVALVLIFLTECQRHGNWYIRFIAIKRTMMA